MAFELDEAALQLLAELEPCVARPESTVPEAIKYMRADGEVIPAFQFDGTGYMHDIVWEVIKILAKHGDPEVVNNWWLIANGWLQGATPMSLVGTDREDELTNAACMAK